MTNRLLPSLDASPPAPASGVVRAGVRTGTATGKVILAGEHACVYGFPAVALGLDRGVLVRVTPAGAHQATRLRMRDLGMDVAVGDDHDLARALEALLAATNGGRRSKRPPGPLTIETFSSLPPGSGLGSSAALGVAIARALDPRATDEDVLDRAMAWERVFHGEPSGVDALVASRGGCLSFVRGAAPEAIEIGRGAFLCVGLSGRAASTRAIVEAVTARRVDDPTATTAIFEAIGGIARRMADALRAGEIDRVGHLMNANQALLRRLGVSTPSLDRMCDLALGCGAAGVKLTGSGGGGSAIAIAATRAAADAVLEAWQRELFAAFVVPIGPANAEASVLRLRRDGAPVMRTAAGA
ncbi:MAG: mevalonate kinase [Labilithrix sp.]|nr:mevalonate kinase [Labilithrix sp.]